MNRSRIHTINEENRLLDLSFSDEKNKFSIDS
jgi:hypothetical protein